MLVLMDLWDHYTNIKYYHIKNMKLGLLGFSGNIVKNRTDNLGIYRPESNRHIQSVNGNPNLYEYTAELSLTFGGSTETTTTGIAFSSEGNYMYIIGDLSNTVYRYNLTTSWDITSSNGNPTQSFTNSYIGRGIYFSTNGDKMFIVFINSIGEYTLSTPWDLTTQTFIRFFNPNAGDLYDLTFSEDGKTMYIISTRQPGGSGSTTRYIIKYSLSTAWDTSTASYTNYSIDIKNIESSPQGIALDSNENKIYFNGTYTGKIFQYNMTTSTLSSSTYIGSLKGHEGSPYSLFMNTKNNNFDFYFVGDKEIVYQYRLILK